MVSKYKSYLLFFCLLAALITLFPLSTFAINKSKAYLPKDNVFSRKILFYEGSPYVLYNDKTEIIEKSDLSITPVKGNDLMVPLKYLCNKVDATIEFVNNSSPVKISYKNSSIVIKPGSNEASVDKNNLILTDTVKIINNRLMVPLKSFSDIFGYRSQTVGKISIFSNDDTIIGEDNIKYFNNFFEILINFSKKTPNYRIPKDFDSIYSDTHIYDEVTNFLRFYNIKYPAITSLFSIGKSVQGRDLMVLKVGIGKKKIFINAAHHPREYLGTILTLKQVDMLLKGYENKSNVDGKNLTDLLNETSFYFLPLVNPDGVQAVVNGDHGRYLNARGVNLNANYDAGWFKDLSNRKTGNSPFSEPETISIKNFCEEFLFDSSISYHSSGNIIFWYFGQQNKAQENRDRKIAQALCAKTGYPIIEKWDPRNKTSMGFKDWFVKRFKKPSFTIEIGYNYGTVTKLPFDVFDSVWQRNKAIPITLSNELGKIGTASRIKTLKIVYKENLYFPQNYSNINGINYFSLRQLSEIFHADYSANSITLKNPKININYYDNTAFVEANGVNISTIMPFLNQKGTGLASLRSICNVLGLEAVFDESTYTIYIH